MLVLHVLVTSVELRVCQAKAYFRGVKCFQARHYHFVIAQSCAAEVTKQNVPYP